MAQGTPTRNTSTKKSSKKGSKKGDTIPYWITALNNKQLVAQLREHGGQVIPCTASTRPILERRLAKCVADGGALKSDEDDTAVVIVDKTPKSTARRRPSRSKSAAKAKTLDSPLGDAHLMSEDETVTPATKKKSTRRPSRSVKAEPTPTVKQHNHKHNDGTLLCTLFLIAFVCILVVAFLVNQDEETPSGNTIAMDTSSAKASK